MTSLGRRGSLLVAALLFASACSTTLDRPRLNADGDGPSASGQPTPGSGGLPVAPGSSGSPSPGAGSGASIGAGSTTSGGATGSGGSTGTTGSRTTTGGSGGASGGTSGGTTSGSVRMSQGVTATTIKVGFVTTDAAGLQSVDGVNLGDGKVEVQATVNWVNAHGGVAGRKIVPVFEEFSAASNNWERDYQAMCTSFTEDQHVFAVVGSTIAYSKTFAHCLAQHNTPLINSAGGVQDRVGTAALGHFLITPGSMELTRLTRVYVDGLKAGGFFGSGSRIGLIRVDDAPFARAAEQVLKPRLKALGLSVAEQAIIAANESLGTTASQMPNVVLRFQQQNINRVLVLDNGTLAIAFSLAATSQGYHPRLGLNSMNNPILMQQNLPASSLTGSVGVGWQPTGDVDAQRDPNPTPTAKLCDTLNEKAGQGNVDRTGEWVQRMFCDATFFLQAALKGSTDITPAGLARGAGRLGTSFVSAMTFRTAFPGTRLDGAAVTRTFTYDTACSCFRYTGANRATG